MESSAWVQTTFEDGATRWLSPRHDVMARVDADGFKVFIDKKSLFFLNGAILAYKAGLTGAGFKFNNPNAVGTCGCGSSFTV